MAKTPLSPHQITPAKTGSLKDIYYYSFEHHLSMFQIEAKLHMIVGEGSQPHGKDHGATKATRSNTIEASNGESEK
jgi:hypothetical protein